METENEAISNGGAGDNNVNAVVKDEVEKLSNEVPADVKSEPEQVSDDGKSSRSIRKRKSVNLADDSDISDASSSENVVRPPAKRGRGGAGRRGRGRGRGRGELPANMADPSRSPRIVLKNIGSARDDDLSDEKGKGDLVSPKSTPRGRGRGRGRPPKYAEPPKNTPRTKTRVEAEDDEEEEFLEEELDDEDADEDFIPRKRRGRPPGRSSTRGRKGKGKRGRPVHNSEEDEDDEEDEEEEGANDAGDSGPDTNPNSVKTGQYLIEKSDMRRLENYPIWRMEGPNMLRKFELIVSEGRVCHKSLYAYSSWAQSMIDLFEKIQVNQISTHDGESIVEIKEECAPKPPPLEILERKFANDDLLDKFYIYIEAIFRQAADPTFLKLVRDEDDIHFIEPITYIDSMIKEKIAFIESQVSMKEDFKIRVRNCPNMKTIRRQNWSQTDQATTNKTTEKGVRSVLMFGFGYDPWFLDEDKSKGVEVAQEVVIGNTMEQFLASYHGLTHFKFHLLRRCQDKLKLVGSLEPGLDIISVQNKCFHDKVWILQAFEDLRNLLDNENLS
ncbi:unnamed protein product [Lymnaea stagnalis]|uniref:DUF4211 domain-containing protein n=1 Tax=Lymnaea stagnalis TaxID=6523 RepID=A0AAV2HM41_LYMST